MIEFLDVNNKGFLATTIFNFLLSASKLNNKSAKYLIFKTVHCCKL